MERGGIAQVESEWLLDCAEEDGANEVKLLLPSEAL